MTQNNLVQLDCHYPIWNRFFSVFPLVVVGSQESDGGYDLAPKHMAMPMSWENYFGFVCTPRHGTYQNIKRTKEFTVSYPRPNQVVVTSLTASSRCEDNSKPIVEVLPTFPAQKVAGEFLADAYLFLECRWERFVDDLGDNSLIIGKVIAAHADKSLLNISDKDTKEVVHDAPLLAYLNPGRFAEIRESYSFPFPVDFHK